MMLQRLVREKSRMVVPMVATSSAVTETITEVVALEVREFSSMLRKRMVE